MIFTLPRHNQALLIRKSKRAKRFLLRFNQHNQCELVIPHRYTFKQASRFLASNETKVYELLQSLHKRRRVQPYINLSTHFRTPLSTIHLQQGEYEKAHTLSQEKSWTILIPAHIPIENELLQAAIKLEINAILKKESAQYLPERLTCLSSRHQLPFRSVSIRNNKTVWGSCSQHNRINLNQQLMRLPAHLIDYILLHELAHVKEKNHGKDFWLLLARLDPHARENAKELKKYSPHL